MLSIWMPVDPVSLDSSVKFVKGSHRWGKWFHPRKFASEKNYPVEREEETDGKTFYDVPVQDIESGKYEAGFYTIHVNLMRPVYHELSLLIKCLIILIYLCSPVAELVL